MELEDILLIYNAFLLKLLAINRSADAETFFWWLSKPNKEFSGLEPKALVRLGRGGEVLALLRRNL